MRVKRLLCPERLRRIPPRFSWVDQRLVSDHHIEHCDTAALALYLFLVTVGDARGLSYYGEARLAKCLSMPREKIAQARADLIRANLIAYAAPLYQVLALDPPTAPREGSVSDLQTTLARLRVVLREKAARLAQKEQ